MLAQKENHAKEQALSKFESIVGLIDRLCHALDCNDADCDHPDEMIADELEIKLSEVDDDARIEYHDEEEARLRIDEFPLDIEVRSAWHHPGDEDPPREFMILLCTGGPAVRITGELDAYGEPESARLEYQDWFTYWEQLPNNREREYYLLNFAHWFYFGE